MLYQNGVKLSLDPMSIIKREESITNENEFLEEPAATPGLSDNRGRLNSVPLQKSH